MLGEAIVIHGVEVVADHVQSRVVVTLIVPDAPLAGADDIELVADTWHFGAVGAVGGSRFTDAEPQPHTSIGTTSAVARRAARTRRAFIDARDRCKRAALAAMRARAQRYAKRRVAVVGGVNRRFSRA